MNSPRYILSFTGARLQRAESVALAELFREYDDWDRSGARPRVGTFCRSERSVRPSAWRESLCSDSRNSRIGNSIC